MNTAENLLRVLALNRTINSTLKLEELLGIIMTTSAEVMRAEAASLLLLDEGTQELVFKVALGEKGAELREKFRVKVGEGIAGWVAQRGESVIVNDTQSDSRFARRFDKGTGFVSRAIICVPLRAKDKMIGVLQALNPIGRDKFSEEDLALFETFADQAAISVENARMHEELVKQEVARQELKIAREIQQNFLPDLKALGGAIDIDARNVPAHEVSGDFYDVIKLGEQRFGIMIGDVSGKGIPAALFMVRAISDGRFLAPQFDHPAPLLVELNKRLARDATFGMFTTFLYLILDTRNGVMEFSSGGHHPPLWRCQATGEVKDLVEPSGLPLGIFDGGDYPQAKARLERGDVLFLYTDGIIEARDLRGGEFELHRLQQLAREGRSQAVEYTRAIFASLGVYTRDAEQHDDMTLVTVRLP